MVEQNDLEESTSPTNTQKDAQPPLTFELDAELGIANAKVLSEGLSKLLKNTATLVLDASQVESVDTAALQLLVGFARERTELYWKSPSEAFLNAASLLDLDQHLGLDQVAN